MDKLAKKAILGVVGILFVVLILLDLQRSGEQVYASPNLFFDKRDTHHLQFDIDADGVGEPHTLTVGSRYGSKLALAWALYAPNGELIAEESQIMRSRGSQYFDFEPAVAGEYTITVERVRGALAGGKVDIDRDGVSVDPHRREGARARVTTKNRQILLPLLSRFSR